MLKPIEIVDAQILSSEKKANLSIAKLLLLGFLSGMFIAFGAEAANMASFNLLTNPETYGLGRFLSGVIFPVGLVMTVFLGAELFTGNCMMINGVLDKKITFLKMLRNWLFVYIGNFIGSIFVAFMVVKTGLVSISDGKLADLTVSIAEKKCSLGFFDAFILGIPCNILVCIAVLLGLSATSAIGKIAGIFLPVYVFVISGFEHSVANMYYIPAGLMTKFFGFASNFEITNLSGMGLITNLIPVTLGNIVGGSFFVAVILYLAYKRK